MAEVNTNQEQQQQDQQNVDDMTVMLQDSPQMDGAEEGGDVQGSGAGDADDPSTLRPLEQIPDGNGLPEDSDQGGQDGEADAALQVSALGDDGATDDGSGRSGAAATTAGPAEETPVDLGGDGGEGASDGDDGGAGAQAAGEEDPELTGETDPGELGPAINPNVDSDGDDLSPAVTVALNVDPGAESLSGTYSTGSVTNSPATRIVVVITGSNGTTVTLDSALGQITLNNGSWSVDPAVLRGLGFQEKVNYTAEATAFDADGDTAQASNNDTYNLAPTAGTNDPVRLDEDGLPGGAEGGPGDVAGVATSANGTLNFTFGPQATSTGLIAWNTTDTPPPGFTYVIDPANANNLLIKQGGSDGTTVLTLTLNPSTGFYTVTLNAPINHGSTQGENDLTFPISYTVTDADGDTAVGSLNVVVNDDSPTVTVDNSVTFINTPSLAMSLDETVGANDRYAPGETGAYAADDVTGALAQKTTNLSGGLVSLFTVGGSAGSDLEKSLNGQLSLTGAPAYTTGATGATGLATTLVATNGGAIGLFSENGAIIGVDTQGHTVFKIEITGSGTTAQLRTTLYEALDHPDDGSDSFDESVTLLLTGTDQIGLRYEVTRTDGDDDQATSSSTVVLGDATGSFFSFDDDGPTLSFYDVISKRNDDSIYDGRWSPDSGSDSVSDLSKLLTGLNIAYVNVDGELLSATKFHLDPEPSSSSLSEVTYNGSFTYDAGDAGTKEIGFILTLNNDGTYQLEILGEVKETTFNDVAFVKAVKAGGPVPEYNITFKDASGAESTTVIVTSLLGGPKAELTYVNTFDGEKSRYPDDFSFKYSGELINASTDGIGVSNNILSSYASRGVPTSTEGLRFNPAGEQNKDVSDISLGFKGTGSVGWGTGNAHDVLYIKVYLDGNESENKASFTYILTSIPLADLKDLSGVDTFGSTTDNVYFLKAGSPSHSIALALESFGIDFDTIEYVDVIAGFVQTKEDTFASTDVKISFSFTYREADDLDLNVEFGFTATITDADGDSVSSDFSVTVINDAPPPGEEFLIKIKDDGSPDLIYGFDVNDKLDLSDLNWSSDFTVGSPVENYLKLVVDGSSNNWLLQVDLDGTTTNEENWVTIADLQNLNLSTDKLYFDTGTKVIDFSDNDGVAGTTDQIIPGQT